MRPEHLEPSTRHPLARGNANRNGSAATPSGEQMDLNLKSQADAESAILPAGGSLSMFPGIRATICDAASTSGARASPTDAAFCQDRSESGLSRMLRRTRATAYGTATIAVHVNRKLESQTDGAL